MTWRLIILAFLLFMGACGTPRHGVYHPVHQGETLYRIGKTYDIDSRRIARANGIRNPEELRAGQKLFIPGADQVRKISIYRPPTPRVIAAKRVAPSYPKPPKRVSPPPRTTMVKKPQTVSLHPEKTPLALAFQWPVKGKIIKLFSPTGVQSCRGIEIAVPFGAPVRSAGAGKVIYSGDGIRNYGNLIILEHENSYFTVYGFNKSNLVRNGAFVGKGEKIALAGRPPTGGGARLHFQVRHGKNVQNPLLFLPRL